MRPDIRMQPTAVLQHGPPWLMRHVVTCGGRRPRWAVRYAGLVSPTVLRVRGFRFYFFSREEPRPHVHVQHAEGEAKFWLEPMVEVEGNYGLTPRRLAEALKLAEEHADEFRRAWSKHFSG